MIEAKLKSKLPAVRSGVTYDPIFEFVNKDDGSPYDLTWCTGTNKGIACQMRASFDDDPISTAVVALTDVPSAGKAQASFSSVELDEPEGLVHGQKLLLEVKGYDKSVDPPIVRDLVPVTTVTFYRRATSIP